MLNRNSSTAPSAHRPMRAAPIAATSMRKSTSNFPRIVEAIADDVTNVAVGDYVILNWRAVCGQCRACLKGQPHYCFGTHNAAQKMTLTDGTELSPADVARIEALPPAAVARCPESGAILVRG